MGGQESKASMPYTPDSYSYTPIQSVRMASTPPTCNFIASSKEKAPLLKVMYHGVWKMEFPNSVSPEPRVGQCSVYDEENQSIIIAYGVDRNGECLNDAWVLDLKTNLWRILNRQLLGPRQFPSSLLIGRKMFIFGGVKGLDFFSQFHTLDIDTGEVQLIEGYGKEPCPRTSSVMFHDGDHIYLWSGYDGKTHSGIYSFCLSTSEWVKYEEGYNGRAAATYCTYNGIHYVFGSSKTSGLLRFDPETKEFEAINCTGAEPAPELNHPSLVGGDEYLFLIGGDATANYMHVYALDIKRKWWFAVHIRPDGKTVSLSDGTVNKQGLFMIPREFAASVCYNSQNRELVCIHGSRLMCPPPVFKIQIGEALGSMHIRADMHDIFQQNCSFVF